MMDGTYKNICDIKLGETLYDLNKVTSVIKVTTEGSSIYELDGILVSNSHIVQLHSTNKWIPVSKHPNATLITNYNKPFLYCLNTTNKTITIHNHIFTDWDEIYGSSLLKVLNNRLIRLDEVKHIHTLLDGGFSRNTKIKLYNGEEKCINEIQIGDCLQNNSTVYGVVEIDGTDIHQFKYEFNNTSFQGSSNLAIYKCGSNINTTLEFNKIKNLNDLEKREKKLYHLLTNTKTFIFGNIEFFDYNGCIDIFTEVLA
jgi:hypothetical protein